MRYSTHLIVLLLFIITNATGQTGHHYVLNGLIHVKNGESYPYILNIDVVKNAVYGFSATKTGSGSEPRITLSGIVNKEKKVLSISEKKLIGGLPDNKSVCMIDAVLTYKPANVQYPLSGNFISKDAFNNFCGEGSIEFASSAALNSLLDIDSATPAAIKIDTEQIPQPGEYEITSGKARKLEWKSDTCILQIYDGGIVDGDKVTVLVNDKPLLTDCELAKQKKQLKFALDRKLNDISIVAGYEGSVPPNTANLILIDGDKQYRIKAFNNAGDKAHILLLKR